MPRVKLLLLRLSELCSRLISFLFNKLGDDDDDDDVPFQLDHLRRRSFGMPNRITLDAERASIGGQSRTLHAHERPVSREIRRPVEMCGSRRCTRTFF